MYLNIRNRASCQARNCRVMAETLIRPRSSLRSIDTHISATLDVYVPSLPSRLSSPVLMPEPSATGGCAFGGPLHPYARTSRGRIVQQILSLMRTPVSTHGHVPALSFKIRSEYGKISQNHERMVGWLIHPRTVDWLSFSEARARRSTMGCSTPEPRPVGAMQINGRIHTTIIETHTHAR
jgi:hypothetical protein